MFIIHLRTGQRVQIEETELQLLTSNMKAPLIVFKQGIINPAFIVAVVPDSERKNSARRLAAGGTQAIPELPDEFSIIRNKHMQLK